MGNKKEMKGLFTEEGKYVPVTEIEVKDCYLFEIKSPPKFGYYAVTLACGSRKKNSKPFKGELKKRDLPETLHYLREFRLERYIKEGRISILNENGKFVLVLDDKKLAVGDKISLTIFFKEGDKVDISGRSKGKGFQGVVKRYGFACGPRTHGQSDRRRAPGSIGQTTTPGRVYKGKKMAGRMGNMRMTIKNVPIVKVEEEKIFVKGSVPGSRGNLLEIISSRGR